MTDPLPPRYEFNALLPDGLPPGPHNLQIFAGRRPMLPLSIDFQPN
jgi:hypothetical protein